MRHAGELKLVVFAFHSRVSPQYIHFHFHFQAVNSVQDYPQGHSKPSSSCWKYLFRNPFAHPFHTNDLCFTTLLWYEPTFWQYTWPQWPRIILLLQSGTYPTPRHDSLPDWTQCWRAYLGPPSVMFWFSLATNYAGAWVFLDVSGLGRLAWWREGRGCREGLGFFWH